jgi:hypothetical protein
LEGQLEQNEINAIKDIISTMSYSTVKKNGYPKLDNFQHAYHIVREADLLAAYDFDRCMLYNIHKQTEENKNNEIKMTEAFNNANELFQNRVLKHNKDGLFVTDYSKNNYLPLHIEALKRIRTWKNIINKPLL